MIASARSGMTSHAIRSITSRDKRAINSWSEPETAAAGAGDALMRGASMFSTVRAADADGLGAGVFGISDARGIVGTSRGITASARAAAGDVIAGALGAGGGAAGPVPVSVAGRSG